jgi:hypothetical protein
MTKTILVPTVLALLCAAPTTASAALLQNAGVPAAHASRVAHPTVFPSSRPQPYPYNFHETDGLSRNPNDCAVWGCIDSN